MNWGQKLVFILGTFIVFIVSLGVYMFRSDSHEVVAKDYYERGVNYDQEYNKTKRAIDEGVVPLISVGEVLIEIQFKKPAKGTIVFFRPSDNAMDIKESFVADGNNKLLIPKSKLAKGAWTIQLAWDGFLYEEKIVLP